MSNAKLTAVTVERFKSFATETRVDLSPLTIILGRNNSGKSSLAQSLMLLKQTLEDPRPEVMLSLEGFVDAFSLKELTYGWPTGPDLNDGPIFSLEWSSDVDVTKALDEGLDPDLDNLSKQSGVAWLKSPGEKAEINSRIKIYTSEIAGATAVHRVELSAGRSLGVWDAEMSFEVEGGDWICFWGDERARKLSVDFDHFIPNLLINRRNVGPRDRQRTWHNAYLVLFAQPLADLRSMLTRLHYLGSLRQTPPSLFKTVTSAPGEIGVSGEFAAQILHRRQSDIVHYLPVLNVSSSEVLLSEKIIAAPLVEAVNDVLHALSIEASLEVEEIQNIGFRLLFGGASLNHVGRGLAYLLPLVELGLFADPNRFKGSPGFEDLPVYLDSCVQYSHMILEEPEAHLHPKVASRLAHWMVSLAMSKRRVIVETHSDHLVRRLRGLIARAGKNSPLETWLRDNVSIISVEQKDGVTSLRSSKLDEFGGIGEVWPADFLDEATDEESAIFYAKLDKDEDVTGAQIDVRFTDEAEPGEEGV